MPIEAELPDGRVLEFPDGTDPSVIQSTVKRVLGVGDVGGVGASGTAGGDTVRGVVSDPAGFSSFGREALSGLELAGVAGSSLVAEPLAGIAGIAQSINPFAGEGAGARAVEATREALTLDARLPETRRALSGIGGTPAVQGLGSAVQATEEFTGGAGEAIGEVVGAPAVGFAAGTALPTAIAEFIGIKGVRSIKKSKAARKALAEEIASGSLNVDNVTKSINEAGEIVTSKASKKALSNLSKTVGKDRATQAVSVIENMTPASKQQVNKMLDIVDAVRKDPTKISRPSDILGQSVANRAKAVANINKRAGRDISKAANTLEGKSVDINAPSQQFFDDLAEMGVKVADDNGRLKLDFSESTFVGGGKGEVEKIANFVKSGQMDGKKAHELKQFIRDRVSFGQGTEGAVSARSQGPLKRLSSGIDDVLDSTSTSYKKANENFAKTVELRDQFQKMAGKDVDLMSDLSPQALGGKARRLVSNAESRVNIQQQLNEADRVLGEFGVKFKDDIPSLNHTVTQLEDIFKITPAASLKGNIERGGANILQGASPTGEAVRGGFSKIQELRQPDFEAQMKTLRALTRQKAK